LNRMTMRLVNRCFCEKIFASPMWVSISKLLERDHEKSDVLQLLQHCDGDIQGKQGSGIKRSVSETDLSM
jgi:hypothetical protein